MTAIVHSHPGNYAFKKPYKREIGWTHISGSPESIV
jgi:hypothetical protein